jgi:DNA-directed DNA polymerase III PolC
VSAAVCLRTHHSLLWGTASPSALLDRAAQLGHRAVVLADRDPVAGAVEFAAAAEERGLRAIIGAEVTPAPGEERAPVIVAARDAQGYATLCRVVSERQLDDPFDIAASLSDGGPGAVVLCSDASMAARLRECIPRDRLFLGLSSTQGAARALRDAARELDVQLAAISTATFAHAFEVETHRILRAAALGVTSADLRAQDLVSSSEVLRAPQAIAALFRDAPDAVKNAACILESCVPSLPSGRLIFPKAPLAAGENPVEHLRAQCLQGLERRGANTPAARERLSHELQVIAKLGFVEYFVIVGDIVRAARAFGIPTVGRGSGASALVAYALGITNVNPLDYDLIFERFLHEKRADCPDLDIDLCWRGRDEVIEHVYRTYGRDRVAMICTHVLFHPRSAFREVARAAGLPPKRIDSLSKILPSTWESAPFGKPASAAPAPAAHGSSESLRARMSRDALGRRAFNDPQLGALLDQAERLLGIPRHFGIHSGGIVIADRPITAYSALARAAKGIVVTQYEMHAIEKIGLVKIDLLGNRALSALRDTVALVERERGIRLDLDTLPDHSHAARELLAEGDTLGVFQIESPGMRNLLRQMRPTDLNGTIAALSLIRPGPAASGMKDLYVLRTQGREPVSVRDPRLQRVLAENYGILLYEEDVMRVIATVCDVGFDEADGIRRAIGKAATHEDWEALEHWFLARAVRCGMTPDTAREVWAELARFGAYSFSKAHASGYGVLAYRMAHLKALFPAEFAVAFLNNGAGMYPKRVHVEDARRRGVRIVGPCVVRSGAEFSVENGAIRTGLGEIAGLSTASIASILEARAARPFAGVGDLLRRTRVSRTEAETLALAGACDVFGENRPRTLWRMLATFDADRARRANEGGADGSPALFALERWRTPDPAPALDSFSAARTIEIERGLLGFPIACHPLSPVLGKMRRAGIVTANDIARHVGKRVRVAGLASARRTVETKKGEPMLFLTLEDPTGLVECTFFPGAYARCVRAARGGGVLIATGRVEDHLGAITITADALEPANSNASFEDPYSSGRVITALGSSEERFTIDTGVPAFETPHCA